MQIRFLYFFCFMMINISSLWAQENNPQMQLPPGCSIIINTHAQAEAPTNHDITLASTQKSNQSSEQRVEQTTTLSNVVYQTCMNWYQQHKALPQETMLSLKTYLAEHKAAVTGCLLLSCYATLWQQIYAAEKMLVAPDAWATWQSNISTKNLLGQPQQAIGHELITEIQQRYIDHNNPTDFLHPLITFSNQLHQEINALEKLQTIYSWIHRCYCNKLFFLSQKHQQELESKAHRLYFIKHVFISWCTEYKLHQHNPQG